MRKFKGYDVIDSYPKDGWLKGYFYAKRDDIKNDKQGKTGAYTGAYQDLGYIKYKDFLLHALNIKKEDRILDIGCADGAMMVYCGLLGAQVYGIDLSAEDIKKVNGYLNKYEIKGRGIIGDAKKMNFKERYFDKVVSSDFFEHLSFKDNILVLKEIKRVLKPGGEVIIKTPNLTFLKCSKLYKMMMRTIKLKNPTDIIIPHTTGNNPQHTGLVTRKKMIKAIKSAGFLNFKFYYGANSKVERLNYSLGEFFAETPFLRDIFTEDIVVTIWNPAILSLF